MLSDEMPAAGPWQTGEPPQEGRYLIEYRQYRVEAFFIGDWVHPGRWASTPGDVEVLRWAEIYTDREGTP